MKIKLLSFLVGLSLILIGPCSFAASLQCIALKAMEPYQEGGIVILGDSITARAPWPEELDGKPVTNLGCAGHTVADAHRMLELAVSKKPDILILWLGTYNALWALQRKGDFYQEYQDLFAAIFARLPGTEIRIVSVLPVMRDRWNLNWIIGYYNRWLENFCEVNQVTFINIFGLLGPEHFADRFHPNTEGYNILIPVILEGITFPPPEL